MVGEMISDAAEAADVVVVAVVIIVKGTAAADIIRVLAALIPVMQVNNVTFTDKVLNPCK